MSKILELAKKLKRLSEQGVGGEAINAADQLEKICKKHGISLADLDDEKLTMGWFKVTPEQTKFFNQTVASVLGRSWNSYNRIVGGRKVKNTIGIESTSANLAEIEMKFYFYWKLYVDELDIFYAAFIQKNQLYVNGVTEKKELTPEEKERLLRVLEMASNIKSETFRKQIQS